MATAPDSLPTPVADNARTRRRALAVTVPLLLAYVAVLFWMEGGKGLARLGQAMATPAFALALALSAANYFFRFWRWERYVRALAPGHDTPPGRHALAYMAGFAFTLLPGKVGEGVRGVYLKPHGVPWPVTLAALFAERITDLLAMLVLAAGIFFLTPAYAPAAGPVVFLVLLGIAFLGWPTGPAWLAGRARRAAGRGGRALGGVAETWQAAARLLAWQRLPAATLLGVMAWGMEGAGLYVLANAFSPATPLGFGAAQGVYAVAILGGALAFFMPGGVGAAEVGMGALLGLAGLGLPAAVLATLLCRLATLWFAVVLGFGALAWLETRKGSRAGPVPHAARDPDPDPEVARR